MRLTIEVHRTARKGARHLCFQPFQPLHPQPHLVLLGVVRLGPPIFSPVNRTSVTK